MRETYDKESKVEIHEVYAPDLTQDAHKIFSDLMEEHEIQEYIEPREHLILLGEEYVLETSKHNFAVMLAFKCCAFLKLVFGIFEWLMCSVCSIFNRIDDRLAQYIWTRWIIFEFDVAAYIYRAHFMFQGYDLISLNLLSVYMFIGYLFVDSVYENRYKLPMLGDEIIICERDFREHKVWKLMMSGTALAMFLTCFEMFKIKLMYSIVVSYYVLAFIWYYKKKKKNKKNSVKIKFD